MIVPDINLLIHAHRRGSRVHDAARTWWSELMNGDRPVGLPWAVLLGFVRLAEWDGKTVVANVGLEENKFVNQDGQEVTGYRNTWAGFSATNSAKHGAAFVRSVQHARQEAMKAESEAVGA